MRFLVVAGGTAGHINPALAIAQGIGRRWPGAEVHFAGRQSGMEKKLVEEAGYPFHHIEVRGIQRSLAPRDIVRNFQMAWYLAQAPHHARRILAEVDPAVVIGAGGYVSGPLLREAARRGYKTLIQEQNAYPRVTNKLLAKMVDVVCAPTLSAVERLAVPEKTIVTGNPVRPAFFEQDRAAARNALGVGERTLLLSFGGSLGAQMINTMVADMAARHIGRQDILHIHATGAIEKESYAQFLAQAGLANADNFIVREYIDNMPEVLTAADLVISRAGALTLAEIAAAGRASVLIPSPNVAENHQYYNALEFKKAGAACLLQQKMMSGVYLTNKVDALLEQPTRLQEMGAAAATLAAPHALDAILDAVAGLLAPG